MSLDGSVGITTGWTTRIRFLSKERDFSILIEMVAGSLSLKIKRPGREADRCQGHEWWSYNSTPSYGLIT
jgi:hypothetical protein